METIHAYVEGFIQWILPFGPYGLFVMSFAESSFFPIPPDVLLMALAAAAPETALWLAAITSLASVLGGMFGYFLGLKGGRPLLYRFFKEEKVKVVERYYHRWDVWAVGMAGLTPLPYKVFTIAAGAFALNFPRFLLASVLSRSLRFFAVGLLFYFFGAAIQAFIKDYFGVLTVAFFALLFGGFYLMGRMGKKAVNQGEKG